MRQRRASAAPSVCMLVPTWDDERTTTKGKLKNRISHNLNFIVKLIMKSQAEWKQDELCSESCIRSIIAFVVGELNWHFTIFTIFHSYAESCTALKRRTLKYAMLLLLQCVLMGSPHSSWDCQVVDKYLRWESLKCSMVLDEMSWEGSIMLLVGI